MTAVAAERATTLDIPTKPKTPKAPGGTVVNIAPPKFQTVTFRVIGTAPYVQQKFSEKAKQQMMDKQKSGQKSRKGAAREPKDFDGLYEQAQYKAREGWNGIPASAFRNAMISACRVVGFKMTHAKLAVFIEADGFDREDASPLIKILKGEPRKHEGFVRNETGVADIRVRPMWEEWEADVRVRFDADLFSVHDVANLLSRAGMQVGVGEGRPDSRNSAGLGWGTFRIQQEQEAG